MPLCAVSVSPFFFPETVLGFVFRRRQHGRAGDHAQQVQQHFRSGSIALGRGCLHVAQDLHAKRIDAPFQFYREVL